MKANEKEETVRVKKLATAAALSLVLALGLAPGLAQADDAAQQGGQFVAGQFDTQAEAKVLTITNGTDMFKAVSASAVESEDGSATLTMALSGSGYHYLYKGTYEQAVANGTDTDNWIAGEVNADGKWEFKIPIAADELGTDVPVVAISDSYYKKYLDGKNGIERAFYPRMVNVDLEEATLTTNDFKSTAELTVINKAKMFSLEETSDFVTVGGPNSNGYTKTIVLAMGSDSFSKAFVGSAKDAAKAEDKDIVAFNKDDMTFDLKVLWMAKAGDLDSITNVAEKPFVVSFWSVKNEQWYERWFALDEEGAKLIVSSTEIDSEKAAKCAELIDKIYVQERTATTDADCKAAKDAWDALTDAEKELVQGVHADPGYFGDDTGDASKDDPLNADKIGENEILVVSFGTSFNDSRVATIGGIEKALAKSYPNWSVRRAFTAQIIINHVQARDNEKIDNVKQAMDRAVANGVKTLVVQPTHLMHGAEYDELKAEIDTYKDKMTIIYAEPLLGEVGKDATDINADKETVAKAVVAAAVKDAGFESLEAADKAGTAFVLMGHGTAHEAKVTYEQMQTQMNKLGYKNVFIGTVEGEPESTECQAVIEAAAKAGYKNIVLRPLMVVAGDHANNDMADPEDEESWYSQFTASGNFEKVECQIAGLGEIPEVQKLYVAHTTAVLPGSATFEDVPADSWFVSYVDRAVKMGIMAGYTDDEGKPTGKFGAGDNVTRGQIVTIMYRYSNPGSTATTDKKDYEKNKVEIFTDNTDEQYFTAAINWAYEQKIMTGDQKDGKPLGTVRPNDSITRQELATMITRWAQGKGTAGDGAWKNAPDASSVADWAEAGIDWCFTNGVMTGNSETKMLNPAANTLREEAAKMLVVTYQDVA